MATSGGGSSLPTSSAYGTGGGGVGGKFQKRSFTKSRLTPYDRPRTSLQNPNWVSKLFLDPASKLLAASARRFFSSVFRKRLPPPSTSLLLPPSAANPEMCNGLPDLHIPKNSEAVLTAAAAADSQSLIREDSCGISELEQRLKQKTLTRHEIDRLTELLQSKAVDLPVINDIRRDASSPLKPVKLKDFWLENTRERDVQISSTPGTNARVLEEDIMTPAELAITYVGSLPSKELSSPMSFHGQTIHGNGNLLSNLPSSPSSNLMSSEMTTTSQVDVQKNGFLIPRPRGRSAIYRMAGTSYLQKHQTTSGMANKYNGNLLASPTLLKQDGEPLWKEPGRKRSSSVLDEEVGSVGPIRRTRGRHCLVSHKASFPFGGKYVSNGATPNEDVQDANIASTSYCHVPPKSRETTSIISLNVEKMEQIEESSESKLITDREKSPSKSTLKLVGIQNGEELDDLSHGNSTGIDDFYFEKKQKRAEENHLEKSDCQHDTTWVADNDSTVSAEHKLSSSVPLAQLTKKKHGFMMSVHEDFLDLDDDTNCNGSAADSSVEVREDHKTDGADRNPTAGNLIDETPGFFETRKKTNVDLVTVSENSSASVGGSGTSFAFPTLSLPEKPLQSVVHAPSSSLEKPNYVDGSSAPVSEVSTPKFSSWTEPIPSSSNRPGVAGNTSLQVPGPAEHEENNLQVVKEKEKSETPNSVPFSSSISPSISASIQPELSNVNNGTLTNISKPPHTFATSSSQTFQFGSSEKTSTVVSLLSNPETPTFKNEADKGPNVTRASVSSPFDNIPTAQQNSQSSFFGLDSRIDSSVKSQSQVADVSEKTPSLFSSSTLTSTAPLNSSIPATNMFGSGSSFATSGTNSSSSSIFTSNSTVSMGVNNIFSFGSGSSGSATAINALSNVATTSNTMPSIVTFSSTFNSSSSSSSSVFSFGASSTFTPSSGSMVFGAATTISTPVTTFPTASTSPSPFTSFPSTFTDSPNNDQMNTVDMAEDPVQSQPIGVFGQQSVVASPSPPGFSFGSVVSPAMSGFQLGGGGGGQQIQSPLIQGPGSFEINHGGNFSLGSAGGDDKSSRRFVKVNKNRNRKNGQRN